MKNKIWIVQGSHGQYSDYSEWPICFYYEEKKAKEHAEKAQERRREIEQKILDDDCGECFGAKVSEFCDFHKEKIEEYTNQWDIKHEYYAGEDFTAYSVQLGWETNKNKEGK